MTLLPFDPDKTRIAAAGALSVPGADGVEVVVIGSRTGLTRYAGGKITQNIDRDDVRAYVRVHIGQRVASASTNQLTNEDLAGVAFRALGAARASVPDDDFPGLPTSDEAAGVQPLMRWDDATAEASAERRAQEVVALVRHAHVGDAAGIYETSSHGVMVLSSRGVDCFDAFTRCVVTSLVEVGDATGWGEGSSHAAHEVDVEAAAAAAVDKARRGSRRGSLRPGEYPVVLEAAAMAGLVDYLAYSGFGAKQVIEGESFLARAAGQQVAAPTVTILDHAAHLQSVGIGFDLEGMPRRTVRVIDGGLARGPVTDRRTARKLNVDVTGHSSGSDEIGPLALNLVMEPGVSSKEDLLAAIDDGLLVTRFHYVNILDRPETLLTGMTRDGTFRIRGGEVAEAVPNFRFTQNVLGALRQVVAVGSETHAFAPEYGVFGSTVAPAAALGSFVFSSPTTH